MIIEIRPVLQIHNWFFFIAILISLSSSALANDPHHADANHGVGALGRIEPRSRIIKISHNAGPEGARVQQLLVHEGDSVQQGQELAILSDYDKKKAEVDAAKTHVKVLEAQLQTEKSSLAFHIREYSRYQSLEQTSATSASLADAKRLAVEQSEITAKRLSAEIANALFKQRIAEAELENTSILAPIAGTVLKIHTRPGERIKDNGLLEMADLTQLDVVAEVYESDMAKTKPGQSALISANGFKRAYNAEVRELGFQVKKNDLNDTDPLADIDNRIVEVRLTLEQEAAVELRHQLLRQVRVRIIP